MRRKKPPLSSPEALRRAAEVRAMCTSGEARTIREAARISLREMAGAVGVDAKAVHGWETGAHTPAAPYVLAYGAALEALRPITTRTPMCEPATPYADRMNRHAVCLERAAEDPAAVADPRVAARLQLMAVVARTAALIPTDTQENPRG